MRSRTYRAASLVVAGAIALATVGCGDGPGDKDSTPTAVPVSAVTTEQFIEQVCAPWNEFYTEFRQLQEGFVGSNTDNEEHRRLLLEQVRQMEEGSQKLVASIPGIGQPDQPGGAEVRKVFVDFFRQEQTTLRGYISGIEKLDATDDQKFSDGIQAIVDSGAPNLVEQQLVDLQAKYPLAQAVVLGIDERPDDCAYIFIAF